MSVADTLEHLPERIQPSKAANWMLYSIGAFVLLFVLWAALFRVDEVSRAPGRVIPSRQLQIVSNLEGGIVQELLVRSGQKVTKGQPLLRLDPTQFRASFSQEQEGYNALVARIARLEAEARGGSPAFPAGLERAAPEIVAAERANFAARQSELSSNSLVAAARVDQAQRAEAQARVEVTTRRQARDLAERELSLIAPLVEKGIEPQLELVRAQSRAAQARGEHEAAQQGLRRATAAIDEAQAALREARQQFRARASDELAKTRAELAGSGEALPALQDRVARTTITAPVSGTVNRVLVATVGGVIRPGEPIVEIVPADDTLVVEAQVSPTDIAFIHPGQKAKINLTAYDFSIYGSLDGEVERISPDATIDEQTRESHYTVRVRTDDRLVDENGRPLPITPGMVAQIDMLGQKRSILSYVLTPLERVGSRALREK